ncbi:retrovirus-related Pol polyprotein from transposon 297 [Trichonephila clavipes]|nr:retrovirus-related Pol polyprotein from transposon 297 [Trichonephila clavipes]
MSILDLRSGYFQLAINPRDIEKTAFISRNGTFAFNRMPFGLSGAAPNFQKAIDIFKPVLGRFVSVYMDGVFITSLSFTEHVDHLNQVFTLLQDAGLTLSKNKCHLARDKLKYLGLIISKDGIKMDDNKVKAITEMKPPKNNREVSKFLGMAGWYQKFIQNYADICEPLYTLKNPVDNVEGSQNPCSALRALSLNSREHLIQEQREDPELGHIYRYLENPKDGSVNATVCEDWSQDFKLIDVLLFYTKYCTTPRELRVYIPPSLREAIINEFHDQPLVGYLGKKTYLKLRVIFRYE